MTSIEPGPYTDARTDPTPGTTTERERDSYLHLKASYLHKNECILAAIFVCHILPRAACTYPDLMHLHIHTHTHIHKLPCMSVVKTGAFSSQGILLCYFCECHNCLHCTRAYTHPHTHPHAHTHTHTPWHYDRGGKRQLNSRPLKSKLSTYTKLEQFHYKVS